MSEHDDEHDAEGVQRRRTNITAVYEMQLPAENSLSENYHEAEKVARYEFHADFGLDTSLRTEIVVGPARPHNQHPVDDTVEWRATVAYQR